MTFITLVALIIVAILLWRRVEALRRRVSELERAATRRTAAKGGTFGPV